MNFIGRLGAWIVYFGVVGLVLIMGWREPLKNHFMPGNGGPEVVAAPLAPSGPAAPLPPPQAVNGKVEDVDSNVSGNRRILNFSTPVP